MGVGAGRKCGGGSWWAAMPAPRSQLWHMGRAQYHRAGPMCSPDPRGLHIGVVEMDCAVRETGQDLLERLLLG